MLPADGGKGRHAADLSDAGALCCLGVGQARFHPLLLKSITAQVITAQVHYCSGVARLTAVQRLVSTSVEIIPADGEDIGRRIEASAGSRGGRRAADDQLGGEFDVVGIRLLPGRQS